MVDSLGRQLPEADFGGGDPAAAGADGIAFDGGPLANAQVTLADNAGNVRSATTDASGYYRFNIKGLTPPFVVKVRRADGADQVSVSASALQPRGFVTINVTALTDKLVGLMADANGAVTPASVAADPSALTAARNRLRDALAGPITNAGLDASTYDPVATRFKATGEDAHAVLLQSLFVTRNAQGRATSVVGTVAGGRAQVSSPGGVVLDRAGNMYIIDRGRSLILKVTSAGVVSTLAGSGALGAADGPAARASFNLPEALAMDEAGTIYVADTRNNLIRKLSADGTVSTLAGSGERKAVDGTGRSASFSWPSSIAVDPAGIVYVADEQAIRKITPAGVVTTVPGTRFGGECCLGGGASYVQSISVAVDPAGNLYIGGYSPRSIYRISPAGVATTVYSSQSSPFTPYSMAVDAGGTVYVANENRIWKVPPDGGSILVAGSSRGYADGSGATARFDGVRQLAVDSAGNLFVADVGNSAIRKITPGGVVSTVAGKQAGYVDGGGTLARFSGETVGNFPASMHLGLAGIAVDGDGAAYVADSGNHAIRKITRNGTVSTLAGNGLAGFSNGSASAAAFNLPLGIAVDGAGNLYVADSGNNAVRKITAAGTVSTLAGSGVAGSDDGIGPLATFRNPTGIALDSSGNVYVSDVGSGAIRKITPAGVVSTLARSVPTSYSNPPRPNEFNGLLGPIAVDANGTVHFSADVNAPGIFTVTADGLLVTRRKAFTLNEWAIDGQIAMDNQGNLHYMKKMELLGRSRYFKLTPGGVEVEVTDESAAAGFGPSWFAVDGNGNLFIADTYGGAVRVLVP